MLTEDRSGGPARLGVSFGVLGCFNPIPFCNLRSDAASPREREATLKAPTWPAALGVGVAAFGALKDISAVQVHGSALTGR